MQELRSWSDEPEPNWYAGPGHNVPRTDWAPKAPPAPEVAAEPSPTVTGKRLVPAVVVIAVAAVLLVPVIIMLLDGLIGPGPMNPGAVVPAVLLIVGLPSCAAGAYALVTRPPADRRAWLATPYVYVLIGVVLLVAAGLGAA